MPIFIYTAKNEKGRIKSGRQEALNERDLAHTLRSQGFILTHVEPALIEEKKENKFKLFFEKFGKVPAKEKILFTHHLAVMIKAGLSLTQGLNVLKKQAKNSNFKKIIEEMEDNIKKGQSFSDSLKKYPRVFSELFINMVKVGETGGNLEEILFLLSNQLKKDYELKRKVKGAMIYPAVILTAMIIIGIVMMIFVVPKLTAVFEDLNIELPLTTRLVIKTSKFFSHYWPLIFLVFLISFVLSRLSIKKSKSLKRFISIVSLRLPILGKIIIKIQSARFARTLSSLMSSGVAIARALEIVSHTLTNLLFRESLIESIKRVRKGEELSKILSEYPHLYPVMAIQMIQVGEKTGTLSKILSELADFYEEEVTEVTKNLSSIIEPVLMIIIGGAVGFFAISMFQPIYSISSAM